MNSKRTFQEIRAKALLEDQIIFFGSKRTTSSDWDFQRFYRFFESNPERDDIYDLYRWNVSGEELLKLYEDNLNVIRKTCRWKDFIDIIQTNIENNTLNPITEFCELIKERNMKVIKRIVSNLIRHVDRCHELVHIKLPNQEEMELYWGFSIQTVINHFDNSITNWKSFKYAANDIPGATATWKSLSNRGHIYKQIIMESSSNRKEKCFEITKKRGNPGIRRKKKNEFPSQTIYITPARNIYNNTFTNHNLIHKVLVLPIIKL